MFQSEAGSLGALAGGLVKFVPQNPVTELEKMIKKQLFDFLPRTSVIAVENPTSNGLVVPLENMQRVYALGKRWNVHVHLDGARIFNA
jgi:threonine aldolase